MAGTAGTDDLTAAYRTFLAEARDVDPRYAPATVNTEGWSGTRAAWAALVPSVGPLRCFPHGWLKVRDRAKNLGRTFYDLSTRVWEAYHAPDKRSFSQRLRRLREWSGRHEGGSCWRRCRTFAASATCGSSPTTTPPATAPATCSTG